MTGWEERLRAARANTARAAELERQAVRDARNDGGTPTEIAAVLGVKNRQKIYGILADFDYGEIPEPSLTPVAYLRGAGIDPEAWTRVERAVRARGFHTTHDRLSAWHLCRGGTPVVVVDFSAELRGHHDGLPTEHGGGYVGEEQFIRIGLTHAKYHDGPWGQEMLLVMVNGGDRYEPWADGMRLDEGIVARLATEVLHAGKGHVGVPEGHGSLSA